MEKYIYAKGRRKTAVATIRLFEGKQESLINEKPITEVIKDKFDKDNVFFPLTIVDSKDKYYFTAKVKGSGVKAQQGAIVHALSRALASIDPGFKDALKKAKLLTRDERMVERKKTGLRKARKAPQYSKR
jgi:small subunit ribosomal protein S9